jgi:DNA-binding NarL/FixJ family response regulator
MSPDFLVVPDEAALERARQRAHRLGHGLYAATIADVGDARHAVLAAVAGTDLALHCTAGDDVVDELLEDLRRLGTLRFEKPPAVRLDPDEVALLADLRAGRTLGESAARLHLSRRTADRRLARARVALGARTTLEALLAAERLGVFDDLS